jgi:hypothetical protein
MHFVTLSSILNIMHCQDKYSAKSLQSRIERAPENNMHWQYLAEMSHKFEEGGQENTIHWQFPYTS